MQTKTQSLFEIVVNYAIGFAVALAVQMLLMRIYNVPMSASRDVAITVVFTAVSIVRSYLVRRFFNRRHR